MLAPGLIKDKEWVYLDIFIPMFLPKLDTKNQFQIITTKIPFLPKNFAFNSSDLNMTNREESESSSTEYYSSTTTTLTTPMTTPEIARTTTSEIITTTMITTIKTILESNYTELTKLLNSTNPPFNKTDAKARGTN